MNKYELQKLFEAWVSAEKRDPLTIKLMGQLLFHSQKFLDIEGRCGSWIGAWPVRWRSISGWPI